MLNARFESAEATVDFGHQPLPCSALRTIRLRRRLLLQGASKLDCTPSLDKYFPPFVSVNHCYEAVLFCPSKPIFGYPERELNSVSRSFSLTCFFVSTDLNAEK